MNVKNLSPLDLCEAFSYGDTRKHQLVPLSHVCEVLFDLDPESVNGSDPVTEDMEEFLYRFATNQGGEIVVNIREALRALDIWQSRVTSSALSSNISPDPLSKATMLEAKNKKLKDVISSLQNVNLELNKQLNTAKLAFSPKSGEESTRLSQSRATPKQSSAETSPVHFNAISPAKVSAFSASSSQEISSSSMQLQVVNLHEQELIEIANRLQFTGVKKLEEFLFEGDANATGFINLKQLCWILADQFDLQISEVQLVQMCMGMKFNSHGQLDYKEFVDVLMDILIYALPDIRESAKKKSIVILDQYFQSGFPAGREGVRKLLDALCSKYDLQGDQCISISEIVQVFHVDVVKHHARELPFPLQEHDIIQLAQPFIHHNAADNSSEGILCYPELLHAILGPFLNESNHDADGVQRALKWNFWLNIYMTLCAGDARVEQKVLAQLGKILTKLDPDGTFTISTRHFRRIFERHICSDDMEELIAALIIDPDTKGTSSDDRDNPRLRYDVLLKLAFGTPDLCDKHFFDRCIRKKLLCEQERLQFVMTDVITIRKPSHTLTIQDFYETFIVQAEQYPLVTVEMLFLFGVLDSDHDGSVDVRDLKSYLSSMCWKNEKRRGYGDSSSSEFRHSGEEADFESIRKLIANCCSGYDFQRALMDHSRHTQGWISHSVMVKELEKMMHEMGVVGVHQDDLKAFVRHISQHTTGNAMRASTRDSIHSDAFFDALLDWNSVINSMRLPHSLVEVKKLFETFDSEHTGTIRCEDWNKAYRQICRDPQGMNTWEVQVLQRRFPGPTQEREQTINYAHLIIFLLILPKNSRKRTNKN
ncbi:Hypothetical protein PHPALM_36546 [Phytophthora palmivora]|uniref:EF-hand domain-containing protein n=1 Tax=Phytophthora palmivora TaxID=4796 RepID=A0A2P4WZN7_9STRA|nr:Hypothetical protein PHPALM_36546 [Phytophthora palmivora]